MSIALVALEGQDRGEKIIYPGEERFLRVMSKPINQYRDARVLVEARANAKNFKDGGIVEFTYPIKLRLEVHNEAVILEEITPRVKVIGYDDKHAFSFF